MGFLRIGQRVFKKFQEGNHMKCMAFRTLVFCTCFASILWLQAQTPSKHKIITFEAPGAGKGSGEGTVPISINLAGKITGLTRDTNLVRHGFLRDEHGKITVFDDPNAGTDSGQGTRAYSINPKGAITGYYTDSSGVDHGYVRDTQGKITNFDAPDAGTGSGQGTFPWGDGMINPSGAITGWYADSNNAAHGFVRAPDGKITEFDVPGDSGGTVPYGGINAAGTTTGYYCDQTNCYGFLRSTDGTFTKFHVLGAVSTGAESINAVGATTGWWQDVNSAYHGFVRTPHGKITKFDPSGAGKGSGQGTVPWAINDAGVISGQYQDTSGVYYGFLRAPDGKITKYDLPGAGTGSGQGTQPSVINNNGAITGDYIDAGGVYHGFLAQGFSDLEYSDMLPEASGTFNDQAPINDLAASTAVPAATTRRPRAALPE
jgi:hypothetical protein